MTTQVIVIVCSVLAFIILGFAMYGSIKKYEAKPKKRKKGRNRYMPQSKKPGKK